MPLSVKTFTDFFNSIIGNFNANVPEIDPTIEASFARASTGANAIAAVGLQDGIQDAVNQSFWQTADDDFLEMIGEYDNTIRLPAQNASGFAAVEGVLTTLVPQNTILTAQGNSYQTLQDANVSNYNGTITLTYNAGIVTVITDVIHTLSNNITVTIAGATQPDYNGSFIITVIDENTFTYNLSAGVLTNDTGTYSANYALLNIISVLTGQTQNLNAGAQLKINVVDINSKAYVNVNGISGGTDIEDIDDYRIRVGEAHTLTPGIATEPMLVYSAKKIAGNTRIFVIRATKTPSGTPGVAGYMPGLGETVIYVLRDDDVSIIPTPLVLANTKQQIIDDGLWATTTTTSSLYVLAPILMTQNFEFTDVVPNTSTMQLAIEQQLLVYFRENAEVGGTNTIQDIEYFLRNVQDVTGALLLSYTINIPAVDIVANSGEIYTLGTVSFV